jgi:hypothetical protein
MSRILLLALLLLHTVACGPDACDPTGQFGCDHYTSRPTYTIANQTGSARDASFTPCACCSKGSAQWQVPAGETVMKEIRD